MTCKTATVVTIVILGICHFSLERHIPRRVDFDIASCTDSPKFELESEVARRDVTAELNSTDQSIFYFQKPTRISMECYAKFPIEIQVEREMPSLVEDVRIERIVDDIFDVSTYCYRITYHLPADYRITGKYTCKGIIRQNESSSVFIFLNDHVGPMLLNNGSSISFTGIPDDAGWITFPCMSTNPFQKPVLNKRVALGRNDLSEVILNSDVRYVPTRGFLISAKNEDCCSKEYRCTLTQEKVQHLTLHLQRFGKKVHFRVPEMKPGDKSDIVLPGPQNIRLYCESNEEVFLDYVSSRLSNITAMNQRERKSFYKYRFSLSGHLSAGMFDITCLSKRTGALLYTWKYAFKNDRDYTPGIQFNSGNQEYPFSCRSIGADVNIFNIQCDDYINCQIAERFSDLVNINVTLNKTYLEKYPFSVTVGSRCLVRLNCAQIHDKTERKQGFIRCIESKPEERVYTQNYIKGLKGQIIIHHVSTTSEDEMLQIVKINRKIYYNETIEFQCEATSAIIALGIQLVFTLQDGSYLTKNNLTHFKYYEEIRDGRITLKSPVLILNPNIRSVACHAPLWNTEGWMTVSQLLTVEMGECPSIAESETELSWLLSDVNKSIECKASGDPPPTISWTRDNDHISSSESKHILNLTSKNSSSITSWILFSRVEESHTGKYLCKAENVRGVALKLFNVKVKADNSRDLIIYGSVFGTIIVFFSVILFFLVRKILKNRKTIDVITELEIREFEHGREDLVRKYAELHENARYLPYKQDFEIPKDKIEFKQDELLGSGAFGIVLKAYLTRKGETIPVAVKTVRSTGEYAQLRNLLSEIKIMMYIGNHPNIIKFIGALTRELREGKLHVVVEFCGFGNLLSFLRDNRETFVDQIVDNKIDSSITTGKTPRSAAVSWRLDDFLPAGSNSRSSLATVKTLTLIRWAYQVASGMEYLGTKKVIHGDLATRNILLNHMWNVKITDFGLATHLYDYTNYIQKQKEEPVPWRWLAPEAIRDSKFSVQTDVWSYGITLWELFTLAEVPYQGFSWGKEFVNELNKGYRLPIPQYATNEIYTKMAECWDSDPSHRPSFQKLKEYFTEILKIYNQLPPEETDADEGN